MYKKKALRAYTQTDYNDDDRIDPDDLIVHPGV
jgi:hypothetical protein